jgi:acyl-coenzyme A thioesterase PaaI-like protein
MKSLQETYAPENRCFGCGPSNERGLRIRSFPEGDEVVCTWTPQEYHLAFANILNGGIVGTLLDCHCNWTAAWALMQRDGLDHPPFMVTAEYTIRLKRPTPMDTALHLRAKAVEVKADRCVVEGTLEAHGKVTAVCRGVFVAVNEGHPAFQRW